MAQALIVPLGDGGGAVPQHFDVQVSLHDIGIRWKKWVRGFTYFVDGRGVANSQQKHALLLG